MQVSKEGARRDQGVPQPTVLHRWSPSPEFAAIIDSMICPEDHGINDEQRARITGDLRQEFPPLLAVDRQERKGLPVGPQKESSTNCTKTLIPLLDLRCILQMGCPIRDG